MTSESEDGAADAQDQASDHGGGIIEPPPLVELRDVGIWYRLRNRQTQSLKQVLLSGRVKSDSTQFWALRHIDLTCQEGQVVGVLGHNGAGKSTLCMIVARILEPDEGVANIRGKVTPLLSLGSGFHTEMTGRDNIFLNAAFLGISRELIEEKIHDIVEFSELGSFIEEPIYTYSSGMRARLGFSVAAMIEPEIMILDEVLGVGDRGFRQKSQVRIQEMMERSKLIMIVSHSSQFLRRTCTHCLWIDKGRVKAFGEAEEVLEMYDEMYPPAKGKKKKASKKSGKKASKKKASKRADASADEGTTDPTSEDNRLGDDDSAEK
ncbi:MAG: ABC-type polysaccharide/polyol phosphate transport system ATPase subunit [Planctomycetota bacterium]